MRDYSWFIFGPALIFCLILSFFLIYQLYCDFEIDKEIEEKCDFRKGDCSYYNCISHFEEKRSIKVSKLYEQRYTNCLLEQKMEE